MCTAAMYRVGMFADPETSNPEIGAGCCGVLRSKGNCLGPIEVLTGLVSGGGTKKSGLLLMRLQSRMSGGRGLGSQLGVAWDPIYLDLL